METGRGARFFSEDERVLIGDLLNMPGHPPVVVRQRGPRELAEISRTEIRSLIDQLGLATTDPGVKRAVLRHLGFVRLTERTSDYLDECLRYAWTT